MRFGTVTSLKIPIALRWNLSWGKILENIFDDYWNIKSERFKVDKYPSIQYYLQLSKIDDEDDMDFNDPNWVYGRMYDLNDPNQPKHIRLDIIISSNDIQVNEGSFKISIPSSNFSREFESVFERTGVHFIGENLCAADDITDPEKRFFVNDRFIVNMEGILSISIREPFNPEPEKVCILGYRLWNRDDKDFVFIVGDKEIRAHKLLVSNGSPVFEKMLLSGLNETKESKVKIVDFDFEVVEIGIKFCYGFENSNRWKFDTAINLLRFADKYDMENLKKSVIIFLASKISPLNVCQIANACAFYNAPNLQQICLEFLLECNRKKIAVKDLDTLDNEFARELLKATFACYSL